MPSIYKKLSWEEIKQRFDREWVELVDYEWEDTKLYPSSGVVRVHAKNRKEFDRLILQNPPEDSALVFVGKRKRPENVVLNLNLRRQTP